MGIGKSHAPSSSSSLVSWTWDNAWWSQAMRDLFFRTQPNRVQVSTQEKQLVTHFWHTQSGAAALGLGSGSKTQAKP
jgi:hypothetical protein